MSDAGEACRVALNTPTGLMEWEQSGIVDEVVVGDWLHVERMDERLVWMRVGDMRILVETDMTGRRTVTTEPHFYER